MSQYYQMDLIIRGLKTKKEGTILAKALDNAWSWEEDGEVYPNSSKDDGSFEFYIMGRGNLSGGKDPDILLNEFTEIVWESLKRYADVVLRATYLEQIPYDEYDTDEDAYYRWLDDKGYLDDEEERKVRTSGLNPKLES
jgi:hypothetical protein